jgi:hypothetical protein
VADGPLGCYVMRRSNFERLLGPYEELWRYEALRKVCVCGGGGLRVLASMTLGHSNSPAGC